MRGTAVDPGEAVAGRHHRAADARRRDERRDLALVVVLAVVALACAGAFLFVGLQGNVEFILERRTRSLAGLVIVSIAIAVATVSFQTVTANRILTPSIMGFDALYALIQSVIVAVFGIGVFAAVGPVAQFWVEVALMLGFAMLLYGWLLSRRSDVMRLLLTGVVLGMLFRGIGVFLQRMLDPDAFLVLQDRLFASFTNLPTDTLVPAAILLAVGVGLTMYDRHRLDVMSLGRDTATNLGVHPTRLRLRTLAATALLVSVSTALVGPIMFFGLIVAHLAYRFVRRSRHAVLLPVASLLAIISLVGGQTVLSQIDAAGTTLSIIIEFVGGIVFIALILRRKPL